MYMWFQHMNNIRMYLGNSVINEMGCMGFYILSIHDFVKDTLNMAFNAVSPLIYQFCKCICN